MRAALKKIIPRPLIGAYHFLLAYLATALYRFPSKQLLVIAVTGTKGKSSVAEMINAILEEAGYKTALMNSIRFKIGDGSERNLLRMTMPGRFFIQRFLRQAVDARCTAAILEMTSEGAAQYRHRAIELDALVFTNLAREHIERHGSFEAYADAKFEIGKQLVRSSKRPRIIVANADDAQSHRYLSLPVEKRIGFSLSKHMPYQAGETGGHFVFDDETIAVNFPGEFSLKNTLAAAHTAKELGIPTQTIRSALENIKMIPGRAERIEEGQPFTVVVDYAHTPDSLKALYGAYKASRKVCVLGNTGGGRDTWKRPVMGQIADDYCDDVILTNEDPYDEDPRSIVDEMAKGMSARGGSLPDRQAGALGGKRSKLRIIMDRREAIREGLQLARPGDAVLITGKGTDPCICIEDGEKIPWSDAEVVREELRRLREAV